MNLYFKSSETNVISLLQPVETTELDRIAALEEQYRELRQQTGSASVSTALNQVRALALRQTTPNSVMIAALETLYDAAMANGDEEGETYKLVLKVSRENENSGPLQGLVTKLLGTASAKAVTSGVEAWRRSLPSKPSSWESQHFGSPPPWAQHWLGAPQQGQYSGPPHGYFAAPPRGRGRGSRGRGQSNGPRKCYGCQATDHLLSQCPNNNANKTEK